MRRLAVHRPTILILRPLMPPAALISSTAIFMPLDTGTPQT